MYIACVGACVGTFALGGVTASAQLMQDSWTPLEDRTPECALLLEEAKIKNMTDFGYYNVDGQDVWYFAGDGTQTKDPELRFVTEGTQTVTKPYTLASQTVSKFSFDYKIENSGEKYVTDKVGYPYIVQILCEDGSYPIITPKIEAEGEWHTVEVAPSTGIENSFLFGATQYRDIDDMFCGFLFKMGGLNGELMIANITVYDEYNVPMEPLNPVVDKSSSAEESSLEMVESSLASEESSEEESSIESSESFIESVEESSIEESSEVSFVEESSSASEEVASSEEESESTSSSLVESSPISSSSSSSAPASSSPVSTPPFPMIGFGCTATVSGVYALVTLVAAGVVVAIRRKKQ